MERFEKVKLNIGGMTCVHCQDKIQSALSETEGILNADVSYGSGTAEIEFDGGKICLGDICRVIENLDYKILPDKGEGEGKYRFFYPLIIFAAIVIVFVPLQLFGLLNYLAPAALADSNTGYGMMFVIGLMTSVHCVAMCGGINLSQCVPKSVGQKVKGFKAFIPTLFYNLGRVVSYTVIGLLLGSIGWAIGGGAAEISYVLQGVLKITAGILMIVMGVNMLGIIPVLRKLNPTMPKFLRKKIGAKRSAASPFIVGILNGIMPCGPLQSMWVVALATGTPWGGALAMFLFSLGTVPLMLGLGAIVAKLGQKFTKAVMTVGSLLVVVLGLAMLVQGGSLTGFKFLSPVILSAVVISLIFAGVVFSLPICARHIKILTRGAACCLAVGACAIAFMIDGKSTVDATFDIAVAGGDRQTVTST